MDEHNDSRKIPHEHPKGFLESSVSTSILNGTVRKGSGTSSDLDVFKGERSENAKLITAFKKEIHDKRLNLLNRVEAARVRVDVPELLSLCIEGIVLRAHDVKIDVLTHFENTHHSQPTQSVTRKMPKYLHLLPVNMAYLYMLANDARNYFEIAGADAQASAFANRMEVFDCRRRQFEKVVSNIATRSANIPHAHIEEFIDIKEPLNHHSHAFQGRYVHAASMPTVNVTGAQAEGGRPQTTRSVQQMTQNHETKVDDLARIGNGHVDTSLIATPTVVQQIHSNNQLKNEISRLNGRERECIQALYEKKW